MLPGSERMFNVSFTLETKHVKYLDKIGLSKNISRSHAIRNLIEERMASSHDSLSYDKDYSKNE